MQERNSDMGIKNGYEDVNKGFVHIRDILAQIYEQLQSSKNCENEPCGIPTGFRSLDELIGGMRQGDLILIGARPGMGKTSFAANIAADAAINTKKAVCFFSLEEEAETIVTRMLSAEARIPYRKLKSRDIQSPFEWKSVACACAGLSETDILIDATPAITVSTMKSQLRCVENLGLIVVDYLQLVKSDESADDCLAHKSGGVLRELKVMAGELDVPVICCTQLSLPSEDQSERRQVMTDLKNNCDAAELYADIVLFLYKSQRYEESPLNNDFAKLFFAKNRG